MKTLEEIRQALSGASLTLHGWGPARAFRPAETKEAAVAVGAAAQRIRARKEVIDTTHPAWKSLVQAQGRAKAHFAWNTFPYVVDGQRLFLRAQREDLWSAIKHLGEDVRSAARKLDWHRAELLEDARHMLGRLFDPSLYPASWEDEFSVELREHSIDPPSYLAHTNAEEYKRELARTLSDVRASMEAFQQDTMRAVGDAAARLMANLEPGQRLMGSNLETMRKHFHRIMQMQFEGTVVFKEAMAEAQAIVEDVDPDELRHRAGLREETRGRLQALLARYQELQGKVQKKGLAREEEQEAPVSAGAPLHNGIPDEILSSGSSVQEIPA
jgi:hypothetical protein